MLSKVKRSAYYRTMDRTYYISSLQRCVQSTAVNITWNLWVASYLQRSLSSLKVHSTSTVKASFFFFFFLSLIPRPSSHIHLGKRLLLFCFSSSSMYCLFFPYTLSPTCRRDLSPPGSLPLVGGDGSEGGVCHHQGNNRCCKQSSHFDHMTDCVLHVQY